MATHNSTGGSNEGKRRFQIGREGGEKTGTPVFLEWLREMPAEGERKGRKFEKRGDTTPRDYEIFTALDGVMTDIYREPKTIAGETRDMLYILLDDGEELYEVEIGKTDSRYAQNFMLRVLSQHFNPQAKIRISPYAFTPSGKTKEYLGVSVYNPDKLEPRKFDAATFPIPEPITTVFQGKTLWDFTPVSEWLFEQTQSVIKPKLPENAWHVNTVRQPMPNPSAHMAAQPTARPTTRGNAAPVAMPEEFANEHYANVVANGDDLPF